MTVKLYTGKSGILKNICEFDKLQRAGETVYSFGYEGGFDRVLGKVDWSEKKTKFCGIFSMHAGARGSTSKRTKIRYVKAGKGNIEVAIYKDTVRIFKLTKKAPCVIVINDKAIATGFMNYWKVLWKQGRK
jgi:hypothetical protein